ncbi:MAG: GNAT family N-acetyltransferase [Microbacterium sp.]|uniref:GNAT family N-acetyltransferase n=1 Tax=Microbacterium sp. TaxID=51671 RepID=UPI001D1B6BF8|nr:GNAT family N-acetyltransferase [Microbacterium sp.]MBW8763112.1 GNAT family N-acetyltransferase [Microbacterium sp.]
MSVVIRPASTGDYLATERIEAIADTAFVDRFSPADWPGPTSAEDRASAPGFVLVAEDLDSGTPIGFVQVLEIEDHAHLEQLSVLPSHSRRGHGRRLIDAARDEAARRGHAQITLRTYADVPWNGPFYETCGFVPSEPDTNFLRSLVDVEEALGLMAHGRRIQMTAALPRWQDSADPRR